MMYAAAPGQQAVELLGGVGAAGGVLGAPPQHRLQHRLPLRRRALVVEHARLRLGMGCMDALHTP